MHRRVLLSGSSGFVGKYLARYLNKHGCKVIPIKRNPGKSDISYEENLASARSEVVVHLAGENIFGFWTKNKKKKIYKSRVDTTKKLVSSLKDCPPKVFICASAIGYYGDCGEEKITEEHKKGKGFLADLCRDWEKAAKELKGSVVISLRFGMVLGPKGGIIGKLLPLIKVGLGHKIGSGEQYQSWITLQDLARMILFLIEKPMPGPVNVVSPNPCKQKEFIKTLAEKYHRPCFLKAPASFLRFLLGEMAQEVFLASTRVYPKKMQDEGFVFNHPTLEKALSWIKKR